LAAPPALRDAGLRPLPELTLPRRSIGLETSDFVDVDGTADFAELERAVGRAASDTLFPRDLDFERKS